MRLSRSSCLSRAFQHSSGAFKARHVIRSYSVKPALNRAYPLHDYTPDILDAPLLLSSNSLHARTEPQVASLADEAPKSERDEQIAKARVVFGSRLAGPAQRRAEINKLSQNVAGVLVPPRPEEPDNCCMSGCVNCVWDRFRDEIEEWAEKSAEAKRKLSELRTEGRATGMMTKNENEPGHVVTSMDDDGGGSETNWDGMQGTTVSAGSGQGDDLFKDIPVGIREFMKMEKKLKRRK